MFKLHLTNLKSQTLKKLAYNCWVVNMCMCQTSLHSQSTSQVGTYFSPLHYTKPFAIANAYNVCPELCFTLSDTPHSKGLNDTSNQALIADFESSSAETEDK